MPRKTQPKRTYRCRAEGCRRTFSSPAAVGAHRRKDHVDPIDVVPVEDKSKFRTYTPKTPGDVIQEIVAQDKVETLVKKVEDLPRVFHNTQSVYTLCISESDLLFIEGALRDVVSKLVDDLRQMDTSEQNAGNQGVPAAEDGMFLGNSVERLSALIFQGQFLRTNFDHQEAL
jgi:hypothetical protein